MGFQTVRGMRDLMPKEARKRQYVLDTVRRVFESYGFEPLDTPAVESLELLAAKGGGGEEIKKEIYAFKDQADRELGLRYDLTVSTARVVASNSSIAKPFKRYTYGKVWRYDRPQAGRYREFTQIDIDTFGPKTSAADFEIFAASVAAFRALGFKDVTVRVSNRKASEDIVRKAGVPEKKIVEAFRALDKLDKIGWEGVQEEFEQRKVPAFAEIKKMVEGNKLVEGEGKKELEEFFALVKKSKLEKFAKMDLSLVRGLEYYTGIVYEVFAGGKWSCGGGGRYDNMVKQYGGQDTPAVGISYGVDRVVDIMSEAKLFKEDSEKVFVAVVSDEVRGAAFGFAEKLRAKGKCVEVDVAGKALRKQFDYANSKGIRTVVVVGPKDVEKGEVTVRDMKTGKEKKEKL